MPRKTPVSAGLPDLECACASVRRAARLVTVLFGREMGADIEPSQFSLLTALQRQPGCGQVSLGRALGLEKTTLSRNLRLMKKNGWIAPAVTGDLRERGYRLTSAGEKLLAAKTPAWKRAQAKLRAAMSDGGTAGSEWEVAMKVFSSVAKAAQEAVVR
jgi:DNA-binding MarR family transcriptional regulator